MGSLFCSRTDSGMVVNSDRIVRNSFPSMVSFSCKSSTILSMASLFSLHRSQDKLKGAPSGHEQEYGQAHKPQTDIA